VTERYFSGGTAGQRGFYDRRLSPRVAGSVVIGGAGLIETSVELRRRLGTLWTLPIGANVFLDGADVTRTPDELAPGSLYWAVGAGGFAKLAGDFKLRIELGYRLNDRGENDPLRIAGWSDSVAFHLAVGNAF
jgi:outer membrane protein assembly factor BamA